jgi:3-oxoacyl-[acyl-carrier protein] reductase
MNIAGVIRPGFIHETDFDMIDFHIDVNLKGTIYGTKLVAEQMVKQKQGHIINIASMAGITPVMGLNLYSTSKFGVRGFSLSIASELQEHNVAVTVVCPDLVDTPMLTLQLDYPEAALTFSGSRHLTVQEIGQVILDRGLKKKQLEIVYPAGRGLTAKIASFQPKLADLLLKKLSEKGLKRQKELKDRGGK